MTGARFEVVIDFEMDDEKYSSQESCDKFLEGFLALLTEEFSGNGIEKHVHLVNLIVKSGPTNSDAPIHKASIKDYDNPKHFS